MMCVHKQNLLDSDLRVKIVVELLLNLENIEYL